MSKWHNVKTRKDGFTFDSLDEAARYGELKLLERAGEITDLKIHTRHMLQEGFRYQGKWIRPIIYIDDFSYVENGQKVVEDVKGSKKVMTADFKIKRKMFIKRYCLGGDVDFRIVMP